MQCIGHHSNYTLKVRISSMTPKLLCDIQWCNRHEFRLMNGIDDLRTDYMSQTKQHAVFAIYITRLNSWYITIQSLLRLIETATWLPNPFDDISHPFSYLIIVVFLSHFHRIRSHRSHKPNVSIGVDTGVILGNYHQVDWWLYISLGLVDLCEWHILSLVGM